MGRYTWAPAASMLAKNSLNVARTKGGTSRPVFRLRSVVVLQACVRVVLLLSDRLHLGDDLEDLHELLDQRLDVHPQHALRRLLPQPVRHEIRPVRRSEGVLHVELGAHVPALALAEALPRREGQALHLAVLEAHHAELLEGRVQVLYHEDAPLVILVSQAWYRSAEDEVVHADERKTHGMSCTVHGLHDLEDWLEARSRRGGHRVVPLVLLLDLD